MRNEAVNKDAATRPACFLYQEGEHFELPPALAALPRRPCEFTAAVNGGLEPHPGLFSASRDPERADYFLFPWQIGVYNDAGLLDQVASLMAGLPYLPGREARHLVFDDGDRSDCLPLPLCLFKYSLLKADAKRAVANALPLPAHTASARADFAFERIRFDLSFIGNISHEARRAAVLSIRHQAPQLRLKAVFRDNFSVREGSVVLRPDSPEEKARRQAEYLAGIRDSWAVLCPPGVGLQSFRLYETMYLGRIPVLFGDQTVYPLEKDIDYDSFSIRIPGRDILDSGRILGAFFAAQSPESLARRCREACAVWHRFFAPGKLPSQLLKEAALFSRR